MISAHLTWLEATGKSSTTIQAAGWVLRHADAELPVRLPDAYADELVAWLAHPGWSPATRAAYRDHLCRFFCWATREEDPWLSYNPALGLPRPKVPRGIPRPATDEQVRLAVTKTGWPWRLHCVLASYDGLRCIEVARLQREDITEHMLYVLGKGGKQASLPTHPLVWKLVRDLPEGPVTAKLDGSPADARWVSNGTRLHLRTIGLRLSMHRLRHWYGTQIQRRYRDVRVTQEMLRHASLTSTEIYTQVSDEARWEALACLPDLTGPDAAAEAGDGDELQVPRQRTLSEVVGRAADPPNRR